MSDYKKISEERIQKAMQEGKFDNLPGKGKPIKLDENPFEPEESRTVNRLLKNNDFSLPWIETWREIEAEIETARRELRQARKRNSAGWQSAVERFRNQAQAMNRRILEYNLSVPSAVFQKNPLNLDRELQAALEDPK